MKKSLQLIALAIALLVIAGGVRLAGVLPVDTQPYVEKKYAGWNGVLRAWVCADWEAGGSFIRWLNGCAADFEKANDGVYIEFTPVSRDTLPQFADGGVRPPELIFFSPGLLDSGDGLLPAELPGALRREFAGYDACPVAMGGSIWAINSALTDAPPSALPADILPDGADRAYCAALVSLLSAGDEAEIELPDAGMDLGLPVSADTREDADPLDRFINGQLAAIPVDQCGIARLSRLQDSGRGPDWRLAAGGAFACTDQLLLAAAVDQHDDGAAEREALVQAFIASLCSDEAQSALSQIGAFSVTGRTIHSDFSAHAPLDGLLSALPLALPPAFSEYSQDGFSAIVREFSGGGISAEEAVVRMGFAPM